MRRRSTALSAALLLTALALGACVPAGRPDGAPGTAAPHRATRPQTIGFADAPAPDLRISDLALPAGCTLEDYTDDLATYSKPADPPRTADALGLLDLGTGRQAIARFDAVNTAEGWDVFAPRLSDEFLVWEEVTPGEGDDMGHAGWRLYGAPIDRATLSVGSPLLVATGRTETVQRPFYAVDGTTVYWTRIASPPARGKGSQADKSGQNSASGQGQQKAGDKPDPQKELGMSADEVQALMNMTQKSEKDYKNYFGKQYRHKQNENDFPNVFNMSPEEIRNYMMRQNMEPDNMQQAPPKGNSKEKDW